MSTRAAIGRIQGDSFEGRYQHSDGYPTSLGPRFIERGRNAPDLEAFLAYIVDEHRAGWSYLAYDDPRFSDDLCYCHWEGREEENEGEPIRDCDLHIEWAYAIDAETRRFGVWTSVQVAPWTPGAHDAYAGRLIGVYSLDDEIDWQAIEDRGHALGEEAGAKFPDRLYA